MTTILSVPHSVFHCDPFSVPFFANMQLFQLADLHLLSLQSQLCASIACCGSRQTCRHSQRWISSRPASRTLPPSSKTTRSVRARRTCVSGGEMGREGRKGKRGLKPISCRASQLLISSLILIKYSLLSPNNKDDWHCDA